MCDGVEVEFGGGIGLVQVVAVGQDDVGSRSLKQDLEGGAVGLFALLEAEAPGLHYTTDAHVEGSVCVAAYLLRFAQYVGEDIVDAVGEVGVDPA